MIDTRVVKNILTETLVNLNTNVSFACAGHGMSSVGVKPTTGSYRQV